MRSGGEHGMGMWGVKREDGRGLGEVGRGFVCLLVA